MEDAQDVNPFTNIEDHLEDNFLEIDDMQTSDHLLQLNGIKNKDKLEEI